VSAKRSADKRLPRLQLAKSDAGSQGHVTDGRNRTIQLAATSDLEQAENLWKDLVERQPRLAQLEHEVLQAQVHSRQIYRLRASGPGAAAICRGAASSGVDCFAVAG
jgi:hypothetical protein